MANEEVPGGEPQQDPQTQVDVIERVTNEALALYDPVLAEMDELKTKIQNTVYDLTTTKDNKEARRVRAAINAVPGKLENFYKNWNQPRLRAAEKMRLKITEVSAAVKEIVKPLDDQILVDEARREKERLENLAKENARIDAIRQKITGMLQLPVKLASQNASSETIGKTIDFISAQPLLEPTFQEFLAEAKAAVSTTIEGLTSMKAAAEAREQRELELEQERQRMLAQQVETDRLRKLQIERDEKDAADRKELERAAIEKQDADKKKAEEQKAIDDAKRLKDIAEADAKNRKQADFLATQKEIAERGARMRNEVVDAMDDSSDKIAEAIERVEAMVIDDIAADAEKNDLPQVKADTLARLHKLHTVALADEERLAAEAATQQIPEEPTNLPAEQPVMQDEAADPGYSRSSDDMEMALSDANAEALEQRDPVAVDTAPVRAGPTNSFTARMRAEKEAQAPAAAPEAPVDTKVAPTGIVRPEDALILHMVATNFGVSEAVALDWFESMDMFELRKHVEQGNG